MNSIGFLGAGNMTAAIVDGLVARDAHARDVIACLGGGGKSAANLASRTGIKLAASIEDLIAARDLIVVAFKPQHLASADPRLAELTAGKLVVSVLAGKRLETLAKHFPRARNVVRTMPNTPAAIGSGITPYCALHTLSASDRSEVEQLLGACGEYLEVSEEHMNGVTALSGSGPAFVFEFAAGLRDAGIAANLPPEVAIRLSVSTLLGAARLLAARNIDPETLRNQVTSPNGTTFAGLRQLEEGDFRGLLKKTVLAAQARAAELSRDA